MKEVGQWCTADFAVKAVACLLLTIQFQIDARAEQPQPPPADAKPAHPHTFSALPDLDSAKIGDARVSPTPGSADADLSSDLPMPLGPATGSVDAKNLERGSGEFVAAPVPFLKPTFGWGVGVGAGYIYQPLPDQSNAPPWITGLGAFYTENESWGIGGAHKMNIAND